MSAENRWTSCFVLLYIFIVKLLVKIMLPGEGTVVAFCGRILALGRWNLQKSRCKCPGAPRGQPPGMAADKCIIQARS